MLCLLIQRRLFSQEKIPAVAYSSVKSYRHWRPRLFSQNMQTYSLQHVDTKSFFDTIPRKISELHSNPMALHVFLFTLIIALSWRAVSLLESQYVCNLQHPRPLQQSSIEEQFILWCWKSCSFCHPFPLDINRCVRGRCGRVIVWSLDL